MQKLKIRKLRIILIVIIYAISLFLDIFLAFKTNIVYAADSDVIIEPAENQYFELKAVEVKDVENQNKQVIMELWGNNIEFKRI